jgi:hypothetical protein
MASASRSPRSRGYPARRGRSRYQDIENEDLAIKCDVLTAKVDELERALAELKPQVVLCYEWVPWLHRLYQWLRAVFKHCPGWVPAMAGEWAVPGDATGSTAAMVV